VNARSIPILLYHHVAPDRDITPAGFEKQLRFLLDQGYRNVSLSDLVRSVRQQSPIEGPAFAVTFDDGYLDNWTYAFPVLRKLSVKATLFLVTGLVEHHQAPRRATEPVDTHSHEREPGGFLSWVEAKEMAGSALISFGSHTHTHRHFVRRDPYQNLEEELRQSKSLLEKEMGQPCDHLSWPWGDYESEWLPLVERLCFRSALTVRYGANVPGTSPYALKRLSVRRESPRWLNSHLIWNRWSLSTDAYGLFYGMDRRCKVWWNKETPYSHG
jgi:peptidoglycan/xylan/chitin deacetylase (PgdA/CDA1 family)